MSQKKPGLNLVVRVLLNPITVGIVGAITVVLGGWVVVGNWAAQQSEQEIETEQSAFLKKFPEQDYNETAIELHKRSVPLGFNLYSPLGEAQEIAAKFPSGNQLKSAKPTPEATATWESVRKELTIYFDQQISRPDETIDAIPSQLQQYLKTHQGDLDSIQKLLQPEASTLRFVFTAQPLVAGDAAFPLPNFLNTVHLHKLLLLKALSQTQQKQSSQALETLDVAWKLIQPLRESPYLIGQLVAVISDRYTLMTLRKVGKVPEVWQQRLASLKSLEAMKTSLDGENLFISNIIRKAPVSEIRSLFSIYDGDMPQNEPNKTLGFLLEPFARPWLRLSSAETYQMQKRLLDQRNQQRGLCHFRKSGSSNTDASQHSWWNPIGATVSLSYVNQFDKTERLLLDAEFTQKILKLRTIAAQNQKWSSSIPEEELKSKVCPAYHWRYQLNPDQTATLTLEPQPIWAKPTDSTGKPTAYLPLDYQLKTF